VSVCTAVDTVCLRLSATALSSLLLTMLVSIFDDIFALISFPDVFHPGAADFLDASFSLFNFGLQ
jgi:hypothetical protein